MSEEEKASYVGDTMMRDIEPLDDLLIGKDGRKLKRPAMPGAGRPLGAVNKFTRDLKQAMLEAATLSDYAKSDDPDTHGTLIGTAPRSRIGIPNYFSQQFRGFCQSQSTLICRVIARLA